HLGRGDHRRLHQRHVDGGEEDVLAAELGLGAAAEGVQRRLGGDVGREPRRAGQHADRTDVDDVAAPAPGHGRQQAHGQAQAAEVVQLHGPLEVVEAVVAELDRAADGAAGVVDQDVHRLVFGQHRLDQLVDGGQVGEVAGIGPALAASGDDLVAGGHQLFLAAGDDDDLAAGRRHLLGGGLADAGGTAGDQHYPALDVAAQRAVDEQVRIQVPLPVVPQPPGVVLDVGQLHLAALEGALGVAGVEAGRIGDEVQRRL